EQLVERSSVLQALVLDAYPINRIDSTAAHALKELVTTLRERGVALYMAGVKGPVMDRLKRAGVADLIGADHFFLDVHAAVEAAEAATGARTAPAASTATLSEA
ncbi:MAG: sodium-independent anion transporter, partial [Bacteroidetes bacterium]